MPDLFGMVTVFSSVPIFVFGRIFTSNRTTTEMSRKCTPVFVKALLADLGAGYAWKQWPVQNVRSLLKENRYGITENAFTEGLMPWKTGDGDDSEYLDIFGTLVCASCIAYSEGRNIEKDVRADVRFSGLTVQEAIEKEIETRIIIQTGGVGAPRHVMFMRAAASVELMPFFGSYNSLAQMYTSLGADTREDAREVFRDLMVMACLKNERIFWPENGSFSFFFKKSRNILSDLARPLSCKGSFFSLVTDKCTTCSTNMSIDLCKLAFSQWDPINALSSSDLEMGSAVITKRSEVTSRLPRGVFVVNQVPKGVLVDVSGDNATIAVESTADHPVEMSIPTKHVGVCVSDTPKELFVPCLSAYINKHLVVLDGGTQGQLGSLDIARNTIESVCDGHCLPKFENLDPVDFRSCPIEMTRILPLSAKDAMRSAWELLKFISVPTGIEAVCTARVLRTKYYAGTSSPCAMIQSVSGKVAFGREELPSAGVTVFRDFWGLQKKNGRLSMGCMRVSINRLAPDGDSNNRDYFLSYSGAFSGNRPHGYGALFVSSPRRGVSFSVFSKWNDGEPTGPVRVCVVTGKKNIIYAGELKSLLFDGKGVCFIQTHDVLGTAGFMSYNGTFEEGEPVRGDLAPIRLHTNHDLVLSCGPFFSGKWAGGLLREGMYWNRINSLKGTFCPNTGMLLGKGTWSSRATDVTLFGKNVTCVEGEFSSNNGKISVEGVGKIVYFETDDRKWYNGHIKNGMPHGFGAMTSRVTGGGERVASGTWTNGEADGNFMVSETGKETVFCFIKNGKTKKIEALVYHNEIQNNLRDMSGKHKRKRIDEEKIKNFLCPITQELMKNPYVAEDGFTYEHWAIRKWLDSKQVSPLTNQKIGTRLIPNRELKHALELLF